MSNDAIIMIATTGFGCGVNYPFVTVVITYKASYSLTEDMQGAGHTGHNTSGIDDLLYIAIMNNYK
jgi:superfamily II DNA helicase RecQ